LLAIFAVFPFLPAAVRVQHFYFVEHMTMLTRDDLLLFYRFIFGFYFLVPGVF